MELFLWKNHRRHKMIIPSSILIVWSGSLVLTTEKICNQGPIFAKRPRSSRVVGWDSAVGRTHRDWWCRERDPLPESSTSPLGGVRGPERAALKERGGWPKKTDPTNLWERPASSTACRSVECARRSGGPDGEKPPQLPLSAQRLLMEWDSANWCAGEVRHNVFFLLNAELVLSEKLW